MSPPPRRADVAVVGGGPAGWALARRAVAAGLRAVVVDPDPQRPWPATYGAWSDELPDWLPEGVIAARVPDAPAFARTAHRLGRTYVVLSTERLQALLTSDNTAVDGAVVDGATVDGAAVDGASRDQGRTREGAMGGGATDEPQVRVIEGTVVGTRPEDGGVALLLAGGETVIAGVAVDCSGPSRSATAGPAPGGRAAQTAVGVVVPRSADTPLHVMDWRDDHGHRGWPTFLYAVPLDDDRVLLEETALARRPGLPLDALRLRLDDRLAARGIAVPDGVPVERVAFVVDTPVTRGTGAVVAFGAAAPLIHPATGFSLAAALRLADPVVAAIAEGLPDGRAAAALARGVVWSRRARAVHHLRRRGLEAVLSLPPGGVVDFFELFFGLPLHHQRAYLSEREDLRAVMAAMWAVFDAADGRLRRHLIRWGGVPIGDHHA